MVAPATYLLRPETGRALQFARRAVKGTVAARSSAVGLRTIDDSEQAQMNEFITRTLRLDQRGRKKERVVLVLDFVT